MKRVRAQSIKDETSSGRLTGAQKRIRDERQFDGDYLASISTSKEGTGETKLLIEILKNCFQDIFSKNKNVKTRQKKIALKWLHDSATYPFSFVWVVSNLLQREVKEEHLNAIRALASSNRGEDILNMLDHRMGYTQPRRGPTGPRAKRAVKR